MQVAYIIGPYRAKTHNEVYENIERARYIALKVWSLGYSVVCPHLNSAYMNGCFDEQHFMDGYLEILSRCDLAILVNGWEESEGSRAEVDLCAAKGIPVYKFQDGGSQKPILALVQLGKSTAV